MFFFLPDSEFEAYLISSVFQVFFAGFDTSSTILSAFMYFMAKNPDIQENIFQEVRALTIKRLVTKLSKPTLPRTLSFKGQLNYDK